MLLVDDLRLMRPAERAAVAALWRYREQVEREAAALFGELGRDLTAAGLPALADRAAAAAADEQRHAGRCRAIIDEVSEAPLPALVTRALAIGPRDADPARRALYASVALGCVTESLSCALLIAMREPATFPPVCAAIDEILKDEVEHSRIGWAHLATAAGTGDVSWLASHIAAMRTAALTHDVADLPTAPDLSAFGILPKARVATVVDAAWRDVIAPGLERFGVAGHRPA